MYFILNVSMHAGKNVYFILKLQASLTDGGQLRIDWTVPETALCDEYRITYWVVSTNNRGSLKNGSTKEATVKPVTISTTDTFVQLSGSNTSTVDVREF